MIELSPWIVNVHVLVAQSSASPVPLLKMPGVLGEFAVSRSGVPAA